MPNNDTIAPENRVALEEAQALQSRLVDEYAAGRDLANQLLGQVQMSDAFSQFSLTVSTSKLSKVKETKAYRNLAGQKTADGQQLAGTWEEFCRLLGRSHQHVDEDIRNLRAMGEKALEAMQTMGIGYRQLREFRQLPEDDKNALAVAAEQDDKDAFIELAETLIAKHQKEKEALTAERDEALKDIEAKDAVLADRSQKITELEAAHKRIQALPIDEAHKALREEAASHLFDVEVALRDTLYNAINAVQNHAQENDLEPPTQWIEGHINHLDNIFLDVAGSLGIGIARTGTAPEWEDME